LGKEDEPKDTVPDEYEWDRLKVKMKKRYGAEMSDREIHKVLSELGTAFPTNTLKKKDG
jgi:hypothetical protein